MKLLLTFFIFICYLLPGEQNPVSAGSHCFNLYHSKKTKAVQRTGEVKQFLFTSPPEIPGENEWPTFVEEDDDENYTRKCKLPVGSFSLFYYSFDNSYHCRDLTNQLYLRSHSSYTSFNKYIAQRVLKI